MTPDAAREYAAAQFGTSGGQHSLMIGKTLSHYRIVEKIGAGGMGEVYRARDERLERDVAVKVLPTGTLADEAARKRFRKEALALSKLNHPHIATVFDFDTQDGLDFLVMEYVPGPSLAETLGDGALSEKEVVRLGGQIASALEEAHGQRVVHRDLKPGNIALTARGDAKVLDFGLAKLVRPVSQATTLDSLSETQGMAGTLPYMAPEQLRGEEVDARTDIHALGAILYEMVTGRRPFPETHGPRLTDAILHQAPPPPGRLKPNLSTRLEEIILKCLEKEPEHRYQSAKELLVDLRRPATPTGVSPRQVPGGSARLRLMVRLGAVGIAVGALLVALVGLNVGGLRDRLTGSVRSGQITSLAVLPLDNLMNDPEQDYFVDGMTEAVITELSKIGALKVISRTSVMRYKETDKSLRAIAADLGVDAIVEGSVLRSGDRVRITAQLIDASTDEHLWADNFDRSLGDILALHSDVAQAIAREIKIAVTPEEEAHLASARPVNPEAHEAYLKGDYHWNKFTREGFAQSLGYFQQAIEIDPDYAPAYAGMARAYSVLGVFGGLVPSETHPKAKTAALKALELDDTLAQAHVALGMTMLLYDWDWAG
ncbi:MAG: protein kinase, partial [Terriglobia bacterium]